MIDYRRHRVPGASYFFTVNIADRRDDLLVRRIASLRDAVRKVKHEAPFHIDSWVVLPEHMHALWTLPDQDTDYSARRQAIKTIFSKTVPPGETRSASGIAKNERAVWQRRFWEHTIRDYADYASYMEHIHFNPVKHGLVAEAADWPYSTFHRCVVKGIYPASWHPLTPTAMEAGERKP